MYKCGTLCFWKYCFVIVLSTSLVTEPVVSLPMGSLVGEGFVPLWPNYLAWGIFYCHYIVIQGLQLVVLGIILRLRLFQTWRILNVSCGFKSCITRSLLMAPVYSVGTISSDIKGFFKKIQLFPPSCSLPTKQKPSCFPFFFFFPLLFLQLIA